MLNEKSSTKKRKHAFLFGERLSVDIDNMIYDTCQSIVEEYQVAQDFDGFKLELISIFKY